MTCNGNFIMPMLCLVLGLILLVLLHLQKNIYKCYGIIYFFGSLDFITYSTCYAFNRMTKFFFKMWLCI